jgi:hypothetical protein
MDTERPDGWLAGLTLPGALARARHEPGEDVGPGIGEGGMAVALPGQVGDGGGPEVVTERTMRQNFSHINHFVYYVKCKTNYHS